MHEFSTAVSIVEAVQRAATTYGASKVLAIRLQIGQMSMLNHDQLLFGIEIASKDTLIEGAKVNIEPLPTKIACKSCSTESTIEETRELYELLSSLVCPKCGKRDLEILQGRECLVKDIQAVIDEK